MESLLKVNVRSGVACKVATIVTPRPPCPYVVVSRPRLTPSSQAVTSGAGSSFYHGGSSFSDLLRLYANLIYVGVRKVDMLNLCSKRYRYMY